MKRHKSDETHGSRAVLAIHRFEVQDEKRQPALLISDGEKIDCIIGSEKMMEWAEAQTLTGKKTEYRFTGVHALDPVLNYLHKNKLPVMYANWHNTGLPKDLSPEEIVKQFPGLSKDIFREFKPNPALAELRMRISQRWAVSEFRKAAILKVKSSGRLMGQLDEKDYSKEMKEILDQAENNLDLKVPDSDNPIKFISIDSAIVKLANKIPECRIFNQEAHLSDNALTAASVMAFSGGIDRFDDVASFWHYCGQDPTSNKLKKGQPVTFSPKLKTVLWQMSESIIKNRNNPWRDYYDSELEKEMKVHQKKYPGCKTRDGRICGTPDAPGHCMAMAKVKMRKEILKRFFLAVKGEKYEKNHKPF